MSDSTEPLRRVMVEQINSNAAERATLEEQHGVVYDSDEIREQFEVASFAAPFIVVRRKSDGAKGSLMFQHSPRFYWDFVVYTEKGRT